IIGEDIGAISVLKELVDNGHKLILFTMRSDRAKGSFIGDNYEVYGGDFLKQSVSWFEDNDIPLYGIQVNPTQHTWTTSPKAYGQLMIDDSALGTPLKVDEKLSDRPFVDWIKVREMLVERGLIK